ncbi:hypothetical protein SORBI_3009G155700 [Sorghum bicolor]|uniref:Uncharacterized protein n=1 Tax=Sorghum bicolor TaxID=4558 RepID=A0A1B6P911_SORBI|nr:hypothetical protein SORBI_3009G155700 [Sorghum bicolor]
MLLPLPEVVWYSILRVSSSSFLRSRLAFSIRFFLCVFRRETVHIKQRLCGIANLVFFSLTKKLAPSMARI